MTPPRGRVSTRTFMMHATAFLVACFAWALLGSTPAFAADAEWSNGEIVYDGQTYSGPTTATDNDPSTLSKGTIYYKTTEAPKGYLISFPEGTDTSQATEAAYSEANYNPGSGRFSGLSPPTTITIDNTTFDDSPTGTTGEPETSCGVEGIGWLVCPVSGWIAEGMDAIYGLIEGYLKFQPISGGNNTVYKMWEVVRNIANILFVIGFLILIYAQITGAVMSNYTIKKMVPRIVIAAVLVNVSFWICALAVDLSNVIGAAIYDLFVQAQHSLGAANSTATTDINWKTITVAILGGGALAVGGAVGVIALTGVGIGAAAFMLIGALIPAIFAVFVAIVILAARQALIMLLIVVSPLAFVAYLLPNTEDWFNRWRKFFTTLMVFYPAFAVIFSAAQLAGVMIIQTAPTIPVALLGLVVQVVPLFITPILIKLSSGVLGTIAGLANDRGKGVFDRTQNWAKGKGDFYKARSMSNKLNPDWQKNPRGPGKSVRKLYRRQVAQRGASFMNRGQAQKDMTEAYNHQMQALYQTHTKKGRRVYDEKGLGAVYQQINESTSQERFNQMAIGDRSLMSRESQRKMSRDARFKNLHGSIHESHRAHHAADDLKKKLDQEGAQHYYEGLVAAKDGTYEAKLRKLSEETVVHGKRSEKAKEIIEKVGEEQYYKKVQSDGKVQEMYVRGFQADKYAMKAEGQVKQLMGDMQLKGRVAFDGTATKATLEFADNILEIREGSAIAKARLKATEEIIEKQDEAFWEKALLDESAPMHQKARDTRFELEREKARAALAAKQSEEFFTKVRAGGSKFLEEQGINTDDVIRSLAIEREAGERLDSKGNKLTNEDAQRYGTEKTGEDGRAEGRNLSLGQIADNLFSDATQTTIAQEAITNTEIEEKDAYTKLMRGKPLEDMSGMSETEKKELEALAESRGNMFRKAAAGTDRMGKHSTRGETRVLGRVRAERSKRLGENVEAIGATMSELTLSEVRAIANAGDQPVKMPNGTMYVPNEEEKAAAMYQIVTKKGNQESILEQWENSNILYGMEYDDKTDQHYVPARDENNDIIYENGKPKIAVDAAGNEMWLDREEAENRSDVQQFFLDAYSKSPHKIQSFSGTARGRGAAGLSNLNMRDSMLVEWSGGKVDLSNITDIKIDEATDWLRAVRDPAWRKKLDDSNPEARKDMLKLFERAQANGGLESRVFNVTSQIMAYLEPDAPIDGKDMSAREKAERTIRYIEHIDPHTRKKAKIRVSPTNIQKDAAGNEIYIDPSNPADQKPVYSLAVKKLLGDKRRYGKDTAPVQKGPGPNPSFTPDP